MGTSGSALGVRELNFLQNRLGVGAGFDPDQFKNAAPTQGGIATPGDEAALRAQLLGSVNNTVAGGGQNANIDEIMKRLLGVQTTAANAPQLANLDPAAKASLDAITAGNKGALDLQQA